MSKTYNTRIFRDALLDADISFKAKSLGFILTHYAVNSNIVYPAIRTLASNCNTTEKTIQTATKELSDSGFISIEKKIPKGYSQKVNHYKLIGVVPTTTVNTTVTPTVNNTVNNTVPVTTERKKDNKEINNIKVVGLKTCGLGECKTKEAVKYLVRNFRFSGDVEKELIDKVGFIGKDSWNLDTFSALLECDVLIQEALKKKKDNSFMENLLKGDEY